MPLINEYNLARKVDEIILSIRPIQGKVADYALEHNQWPPSLESIKINPAIKLPLDSHYEVKNGVISVYLDNKPQLQGQIVFTPSRGGNSVTWTCDGSSLPEEYRSDDC